MTTLATETWTGTTGAAWPAQWTITSRDTGTATIQSNAGEITSGSGVTYSAGNRAYLSGMAASSNTVLQFDFKTTVGVEAFLLVSIDADNTLLGSNNWYPQNGYSLRINTSGTGAWDLQRQSANSQNFTQGSPAMSGSLSLVSNTYYTVRFQRVGSTVRFKLWTTGNAEPATWNGTFTDTAPLAAGRVMLSPCNGADAIRRTFTFDNLSVVDAPKIDTLTDDFTTADTAKWSGFDSSTTVVSGRLQQAVLSSYAAGLTSIATYDLTSSSLHATLVQAPNLGNSTTEGYFRAEVDATNYVGWYVGDGNQLVAERKVAGTRTVVVALTYSATTHQRLRIRESGGTVFYDTYDGSTWTQRGSWVISGFAVTSVKPGFVAGYWGTEPSPGVVQWDDYNIAPPAPVVVNPALTGSGTLTATVIPIKTVSASLTGSGALSGAVTPKLTASPSLTGSGTLTGTTIHVAAAALSGSGTLTADFGALAVNANLTGSGTLTASIFSIVVSPNLTGAGTLTATYGVVGAYNVALSGSGDLTAVATPKLSVACDLRGDGVLAAPSTSYRLFGWIFRTPTQEVWFHIAGRALVGKYDQGLTVYRVAGQWRTRLSPGPDELTAADRYFQGGYLHRLSDADRADLTAGGFADNITYEEVTA